MAVFFPDEIKTTAQDAKVADAEFIKDSSLNNVSQKTLNKNIPFKTLPFTQMLSSKPSNVNTAMVYTGDGATGVYAYKEGSTDHPEVVFILGANSKYYTQWDVAGYPSSEAYANSEYNLFLVNGTINRMVNGVLTPLASGDSGGGSGLPDGVTITYDAATEDYIFGNDAKLGAGAVIGSHVSFERESGLDYDVHLVVGSSMMSFGADAASPVLKIESDPYGGTGMVLKIGTAAAEVRDGGGNKLYDLSGGGGSGAVVADTGHSLQLTEGTLVYNIDGTAVFGVRKHEDNGDYVNISIGSNKLSVGTYGIDILNIACKTESDEVSLNYLDKSSLTAQGHLWFGTNMTIHQEKNLPGIVFDEVNKRVVFAVSDSMGTMGSLWYAVLPVVENLEDASVATVDEGVMTL